MAYFSYLTLDAPTNEFISLALVIGYEASASMWMTLYTEGISNPNYTPLYFAPINLVPGSHILGLLYIVEYRTIVKSLGNMMGFTTVRSKNTYATCELT